MRKRDFQMNLAAVLNAALRGKLRQGEAAVGVAMANQTVRCMRPLVQIVVKSLRCPSSPAEIDRSTAKTAIHRNQGEIAGRNWFV